VTSDAIVRVFAMRQISYTNPFRYQGACPNILLRCIDPRFHAALEQALPEALLQMSGSGAFASLGLPGGAKALLDPETRPVVFQALDLAIEALRAHRVLIADHVDCRANGGSERHGSPPAEAQFHGEQLREAREIVHAAYPRLEIVLLWQDWESITEVEG
jgi:hypothetical protein